MERIARREEHRTSGASDEAARPNHSRGKMYVSQKKYYYLSYIFGYGFFLCRYFRIFRAEMPRLLGKVAFGQNSIYT
jgi:hypothetical protein